MAMQNEVVKFVAEMELDENTVKKFTSGLKMANDHCDELRKTIAANQKELMKLSAAGKENTDEFKNLKKELAENSSNLKNSTEQANKYASALGVNQMTANQLKGYIKRLRTEMNSLHKDTEPEVWDKYNEKLKQAETRMRDLEGGLKPTKSAFEQLQSIGSKFGPQAVLISKTINLLKSGFLQMTEQSQVWGDKWQMTVTKVQAGWNQFIANLFQGKDVVKASVNDAIKAAADAQLLVDELFERENSTSILTVKIKTEINELMGIVKDVSKSDEERYAALEKVFEKEAEIADMKKKVAQQDLDAKTLALSTRTGLSGRPLEIMVDEYEKYRDLINISAEYDAALEELAAAEKLYRKQMATSSGEYWKQQVQLEKEKVNTIKSNFEQTKRRLEEEQKTLIEGSIDTWKGWYKQYNLSNDELVKGYVEAKVAILQIDSDLEQHNAKLAGRRGELTNQMNAEAKEQRDREYADAIDRAELSYRTELNCLKQQLLDKEISQEEYNARSVELERTRLETLKSINIQYGKDITVIDGQILDERLKNQVPEKKDRPVIDLSVSGDLESKLPGKVSTEIESPGLAQTFETEMTALNVLHASKMISEEEFLKEKSALLKKYNKEDIETEQTLWEQGVQGKLQATQMMLDAMGQAVSSAKDAELATLDAKMQAELAAAGDNADKRAEIEAKYEAKKLDVQKKYADVELGINIAQALAQGALAVIQTWAQLGPIAGSIMAGVVAATTAAQVAVMVQQRNAIKNSTVSSSPSSTSSGSNTPSISNKPSNDPTGTTYIRQLSGYSEGGYTGSGGRLEVAGVVHRGEYVVPQPEMRDPAVLAMVASIENRRRRRTSANALPGFAEGGYTGDSKTEQILADILRAIESDKKNPIPAYVVYSDLQAKQQTYTNLKRAGALRSK